MNHLDQTCQSQGQFDNNQYIGLTSKMLALTPQEKAAVKQLLITIIQHRHPGDDKEFRLLIQQLPWAMGIQIQTITLEDINEIRQKKKPKHKEKRLLDNLEEKPFGGKKIQLEDAARPSMAKVQISGSQQYLAIDFPKSFFSSSQSSKEKSSNSQEEKEDKSEELPIGIVQVSASQSMSLPEGLSEYQEPSDFK